MILWVFHYAWRVPKSVSVVSHFRGWTQHTHSHHNDVIMGAIAFHITSLMIVYSTVYSDADQRIHQSSASLAFVRGIHRWSVNSPHTWPVTRKMFPFDDVIMVTNFNWDPSPWPQHPLRTPKTRLGNAPSVVASQITGTKLFVQQLLHANNNETWKFSPWNEGAWVVMWSCTRLHRHIIILTFTNSYTHYSDVIMSAMASQSLASRLCTQLFIVNWTFGNKY